METQTPQVLKTPVKKTTKRPVNRRPHKYIDCFGNKNRYVRFWFRVPTVEDGEAFIKELYDEKVIDWSYINAYSYPANEQKGYTASVTIHGILRVPQGEVYNWQYFRNRWPKAFIKHGFYPENSYPKQTQEKNEFPPTQPDTIFDVLEEGQL